jgi:hypothetical protein
VSEHKSLIEAMAAAQEAMPPVEPDATNPHFKSRFVSLGHLLSKVRPVLREHGLVVMQAPHLSDGQPAMRVVVAHVASGERETFDAPLPMTKSDPQALGSSITYLRRYTLASLLGISDQEDDDGNAGSGRTEAKDNGQPIKPGPGPATEGQRKFLSDLLRKQGVQSQEQVALVKAHTSGEVLSKGEAGTMIDALTENAQAALAGWRAEL